LFWTDIKSNEKGPNKLRPVLLKERICEVAGKSHVRITAQEHIKNKS